MNPRRIMPRDSVENMVSRKTELTNLLLVLNTMKRLTNMHHRKTMLLDLVESLVSKRTE